MGLGGGKGDSRGAAYGRCFCRSPCRANGMIDWCRIRKPQSFPTGPSIAITPPSFLDQPVRCSNPQTFIFVYFTKPLIMIK